MWLLNAKLLTHKYFEKPPERYAILSHVWKNEAHDFQAVKNAANPKELLGNGKIAQCCHQARLDGFNWVWIDICCIDKTNSVELSEAINSMYRWYMGATICYAYLFDVDPAENPGAPASSFRRSKWFTRGWTLQELVAAKEVVFFARDWTIIGGKDFFADLLRQITGIDVDVLTGQKSLGTVAAARRLSWASLRETTRVEDGAYSLMGIFDINMPTIYGEGPRSFLRLQEEIMRSSGDNTLFAWGQSHMLSIPSLLDPKNPTSLSSSSGSPVSSMMPYDVDNDPLEDASNDSFNLLASSIRDFSSPSGSENDAPPAADVVPASSESLSPVTLPHDMFTKLLETFFEDLDRASATDTSFNHVSSFACV